MVASNKSALLPIPLFTEQDRVDAINIMADGMEDNAKYIGPGLNCIGGDKTILAEIALNYLLKHFKISR